MLVFDWENMEKTKEFFTSESLKKVLKKGGAEQIETIYLEKIEKATKKDFHYDNRLFSHTTQP